MERDNRRLLLSKMLMVYCYQCCEVIMSQVYRLLNPQNRNISIDAIATSTRLSIKLGRVIAELYCFIKQVLISLLST